MSVIINPQTIGEFSMTTMEGKKVPQVTFHTRQGDQWVDVTSAELFDNKTVVVFSLPARSPQLVLPPIYHAITN